MYSTVANVFNILIIFLGLKPFKCHHCDLTFRTSGHRKSHMVSHFRDRSARRRKKYVLESETLPVENPNEELHPTAIPGETISITTEPCAEMIVPVGQDDIQLQLPTLIGQNIQITSLDPSFLSKPIQIDPALLQQLQQNFNINITLTPSISDQNKLVDVNQSQPILNIEPNSSAIPVTNGTTFTVNPMLIQHLGYTIPEQPQTQVTDSLPLAMTEINSGRNESVEVFQNNEVLDSQVLACDTNIGTEVILGDNNKTTIELIPNEKRVNLAEGKNSTVIVENFTCPVCSKSFKTPGQLDAHQAIHKTTKYTYHCQICNKSFKKENHFMKHILIHKS